MAFALGTNTMLGVANQTGWGSPVAAETYIDFLLAGETLSKERTYSFVPRLDGTSQRKEPYLSKEVARGSLPMLLNFEGIEWFLYQLLGTGITPAGPTDGTYTWTFTPAATLPAGLSLYMQRDVKQFKYTDAMIAGATFEFNAGEPAKVSFDVIAATPTEDTVVTRATIIAGVGFSTYAPVLHTYGSIKVETQEVKTYLKSATINVVNPLCEEQSIASTAVIQPQFTDKMAVSGSLTGWIDSTSYAYIQAMFDAGTDATLLFTYTGGIASGTTNYSLAITMESCYFSGSGDPTTANAGLIECTWPFEAWYDGTNDQIEIVLVNTNPALA